VVVVLVVVTVPVLIVPGGLPDGGLGFFENVAVMVSAASSLVVHVPAPEQGPLHPPNDDPDAGVAVKVISVPCGAVMLHVPGQLIAEPETEPSPEPVSKIATNSPDVVGDRVPELAMSEVSVAPEGAPSGPQPDQPPVPALR
jgi:hypothetical protein